MKSNIEIRRYQSGDESFISKIFYNTIHTINKKDYSKKQLDAWAPSPLVQDYSGWMEKLESIKPFVALINSVIVGFAEFESNGHIDCFYVHHDFQNMGVGAALISAIEKDASEKLLSKIYAEVSITAKSFFEAKGFTVIRQQTVQIRNVDLANYVMEKRYYNCKSFSHDDIATAVSAFSELNWNKDATLFEKYLRETVNNERLIWSAFIRERFAGYVTLKWQSLYLPFKNQNIPEIIDLNVLPYARKIGIGSMLLDMAEKTAAIKADTVGIGVGLYAGSDGGYGHAQRLYIKRGYIPDGKGITYNYQPTTPGATYPLDDNLILWLTKKLYCVAA